MGQARYHALIAITAALTGVFLLLALVAVSMVTIRLQSGQTTHPTATRAAPTLVPFPAVPTVTTAPATATPFSLLDTLPRRMPQPEPYPGYAEDMYEDYIRDQAEQDAIDGREDYDYGPDYEYGDFDEDGADAAEGAADDALDDWMSGQ